MIKGIIVVIVVLIILHYYGIDINDIVVKIAGLATDAWQWIIRLVTSA